MTALDIGLIDSNPNQPRKWFNGINELAESIRENGLLEPIMVRPAADDRYEIIHGERRWRACKLTGLEKIEATVRDATDAEAYQLALIENVQRRDLDALEEAAAFEYLLSQGMNQTEVGSLIKKSQQFVADRISLLKLPAEVKDLITARAVTPSFARRLTRIPHKIRQIRLARKAAEGGMTVSGLDREWERARAATKEAETIAKATTSDPERQAGYVEALLQYGKDGDRAVFSEMAEDTPDVTHYEAALKKGELTLDRSHDRGAKIKMEAALPLTGQTWVWPKYSGATHLNGPHVRVTEAQGVDFDRWYEDLSIPPFSDDEWAEFWSFCERLALEELDIPAREWLKLPETELRHLCPVIRQTYDPDYGGELFEVDVCSHDQHAGSLVFVKKGWGMWTIVEFNDGDGGRTRRRFFNHDYVDPTFIQQAMDTVNTDQFSYENLKRLRLWDIQPHEMSWYAFRRKTVPRAEMIEALEADLETLKSIEPFDESELRVRLETLCLITVPCEPPCEESDVGDKNPCLCGGD